MSTPTGEKGYEQRVMIEVIEIGIPRRVNVWKTADATLVSFPSGMTEPEATAIVARGLGMLKPLDVAALFTDAAAVRKAKRFIDTEDD